MSFGSPNLASGICFNISTFTSSASLSVISVVMKPGAIAFTLIFLVASSFAVVFVKPITPALAAT